MQVEGISNKLRIFGCVHSLRYILNILYQIWVEMLQYVYTGCPKKAPIFKCMNLCRIGIYFKYAFLHIVKILFLLT